MPENEERGFWPVFVGLLLLSLAPVARATVLPMADWPSHLAMIRILGELGDPASPFQTFFARRPGFTPYVGFYWSTRVLAAVMPLEAAGRIFLCTVLVALPLSTLALIRAFGGSRWLALLAIPFAFAFPFHLGLVPYMAGIPPAIATVALTVARLQGRLPAARWDVVAAILPIVSLLLHAHAFAFALTGAFLCALITRGPDVRTRGRLLLPILPAALLFGFWTVGTGLVSAGANTAEWSVRFDPVSKRMLALAPNLTAAYKDTLDTGVLQVFAVLLGSCALIAIREPARRENRTWPAAAAIAIGASAGYLVAPAHLERGAMIHMLVYQRFLLFAVVGLIALVGAFTPSISSVTWRVGAVTLVVVNTLYTGAQFDRFDREAGDLASLLAPLADAEGSCAVSMVGAVPSRVMRNRLSHTHLPDYATVWHGTIPGAPLAGAAHVPVALRGAAGNVVTTWENAALPILPFPTMRPLSEAQASFYRFVFAARGEPRERLLPPGMAPLRLRGETGEIALWENVSGRCGR